MASLAKELSAAAGAAFDAMGLEARFGEVRRSDKPELETGLDAVGTEQRGGVMKWEV